MNETLHCTDCGNPMSGEGWSEEMCPACLMRLALVESSADETGPGGPATAMTQDLESNALSSGQILGKRYGIRSLLGRGGMGEVWRAFDLKLRVDVALKAVRADLLQHPRVMDSLRREVRAAREVSSPNVCRVYDLEELDDRELVSMEYVQGDTLGEILRSRGPLGIQEAREIASQLLAGLEAIHHAGLVHRDLKPANVMITPASRVVVMDFGLAKGLAEAGTGTVAGTPAYMAPEQARGEDVDARADVFAAGLVLAEMLAPGGDEESGGRQALWRAVRREPPQLPDSPWRAVLEKAVHGRPEVRFATAAALARALEEVTLRVEGAEDLVPYPGLASFTIEDSDYFFGRELEIESLWKKLRRLSMLALIGPSGAGKTSFLRAGLLATEPPGWAHMICNPGQAPLTALREALVPVLSGDSEAMRELVRVEDPEAMVSAVTRWRSRSRHALLVVDQFEELFTLNPPEVQAEFAELLGRLALDADVRVLLSMRDDFLINCHGYEPLKPILTELTLLGPPTGAALRRAVVQPALKCGYRFEDEALVDEMLEEVHGERGALPLLAFAAEQLWERRDKSEGLLTREAYEVIGGVAGALAQHAELTLERIGLDRIPVVRELFRNLVTAQGTRAVRDRGELLSVFEARGGKREAAAEIVDALVDARLLTSYSGETGEGEDPSGQRIEIVHESLLAAWPRLVRWMAQDVEGARMRDDLRQAARMWQERDRPDDLLWSGTAYTEYQVWRERYAGRLSGLEEAFVAAMAASATRRRRRRRVVLATVLAVSVAVAAVTTALWRRSVLETRRAEAAARRAVASKLLTLGHVALGTERTGALAFSIASLEYSDTPEARRLALEALLAGPPATVLPQGGPFAAFSPDGEYLAIGNLNGKLGVFHRDGGPPIQLHGFEDRGYIRSPGFSADSRFFTAGVGRSGEVRVWETGEWELIRLVQVPDLGPLGRAYGVLESDGAAVLTVSFQYDGPPTAFWERHGQWLLDRWPLDGGPPQHLGAAPGTEWPFAAPDLSRGLVVVGKGDELHLHRIDTFGREPSRVIARDSENSDLGLMPVFDPINERVALFEVRGRHVRLWPLAGDGHRPELVLDSGAAGSSMGVRRAAFSPDGSFFAIATDSAGPDGWLWDLRGPASAKPLGFDNGLYEMWGTAFSPDSRWLTTSGSGLGRSIWPLDNRYARILRQDDGKAMLGFTFAPDGSRLFVVTVDAVQSWSLAAGAGEDPETLYRGPMDVFGGISVHPHGRFLVAAGASGLIKVPLDGGPASVLVEHARAGGVWSPDGRLLATPVTKAGGLTLVVRDLESGQRWEIEPPGEGDLFELGWNFDAEGLLLVTRGGVLSRCDPRSGSIEVLINEGVWSAFQPRGARKIFLKMSDERFAFMDPDGGSLTVLPFRGGGHGWAVDPAFQFVVIGFEDGTIQVQPISGGEPHLILGHEGTPGIIELSPDGRWIASFGDGRTIRLWPVPDLSKPPLHTLPYDQLMAKLKALTNLRTVPDEESYTGYRLEPDPDAYRGWAEVPTW